LLRKNFTLWLELQSLKSAEKENNLKVLYDWVIKLYSYSLKVICSLPWMYSTPKFRPYLFLIHRNPN
jgi:hypothetical protein